LLIRIALFLEQMKVEDLAQLENLLDNFEQKDPMVKLQLIDLFQEKYQIDLSADLEQLIEDQINKVK